MFGGGPPGGAGHPRRLSWRAPRRPARPSRPGGARLEAVDRRRAGRAAARSALPGHRHLRPGQPASGDRDGRVMRLVLGTDYPPAGRSPKPTIDLVESLGLSDEDGTASSAETRASSRPFRPAPSQPERSNAMATSTTDIETDVNNYIADLNEAAQTRALPAGDHEVVRARRPAQLPQRDLRAEGRPPGLGPHAADRRAGAPRGDPGSVQGRERSRLFVALAPGGNIPQPIYNLQETQFDDRTLISELHMMSADGKPGRGGGHGRAEEPPGPNLRRLRGHFQRLLRLRRSQRLRRVALPTTSR